MTGAAIRTPPRLLFARQQSMNCFSSGLRGLMRPKAQDHPACGLKGLGLFAISSGIAFQLGCPVLAINFRLPTVLGTRVPETSVDEDRDLTLRKCDVWTDKATAHTERKILPESVTEAMQGCPQCDLWNGV